MPDLTFGEQVKIVLSRKGMTIKELAEIIEKRTGKKMSRQNLTQRLGRDNFQEQDMRMIAEILECPFRLSILLEGEAAEEAGSGDKPGAQPEPQAQPKPQPTTKEGVRIAKAKARKEKKAKEAERLAEAMERVPSEMRREPIEKEMTLGDYMDIHEELVRQETERLPKVSETAPESRKPSETEAPGNSEQLEDAQAEAPGSGEPSDTAETSDRGGQLETVRSEASEREEKPANEEQKETGEREAQSESGPEESLQIEEQPESGKPEAFGNREEPEAGETEAAESNTEPKVDVEELLREMEELEKERRLLEQQEKEAKEAKEAREKEEPVREEKKITGWRAMFQRRTKKERQEELQEEARIVEQVILREPTLEELEDDYIEYDEPETEPEADEFEPQEGNGRQTATEDIIEELMEADEDEDAEDLSRGEMNPYTGHEYETNSVRMHPKRIGYVQLYDRRDHGWTDMTEWAFLGYQERKRALLGKDYDPPIYLD
ncbi:MAG: hypothetical protein HFH11_01610 [Dorea sp.]|jgi:hypothetical protein|nr:hypothetical protein [Dorea sp.]